MLGQVRGPRATVSNRNGGPNNSLLIVLTVSPTGPAAVDAATIATPAGKVDMTLRVAGMASG